MIYDCFLFSNEVELALIRMHELDPVVDKFVIIEANTTIQGAPRQPVGDCFSWAVEFEEFRHKIDYHLVTEPLHPHDPWRAEWYARDQIMRGLTTCDSQDFVIISDVDEIPRASAVREAAGLIYDYVLFDMNEYYYSFTWRIPLNINLNKPLMTKFDHITTPSRLRRREYTGPCRTAVLPDAGWHFSCLGPAERLAHKLQTFSHKELNTPAMTDLEYLTWCIETGRDFVSDRFRCQRTPLDESYPAWLLEHADLFREWSA